jgi:GT2 family glycosyltransferase
VYVPNVNEGYPGGNVTGLRYAKGDYVMITNPDTTLEKGAIERLVRDFLHRPDDVMVLVPKILIRQTNVVNSIGMKRIRPMENIYTNIGYLEYDLGQFDAPRKVEAFDGSAIMFRKTLLHHTYLFDPRYFFGNETVDLAERMAKLGFSAYTCPAAVVRHELRGTVTSAKQNDRITAIIVRNSLIHTLQNTDLSMFLRTLIMGICFRNILGRIVTGQNPRTGVTYLRGLVMFLTELGRFTRKPYHTNQ